MKTIIGTADQTTISEDHSGFEYKVRQILLRANVAIPVKVLAVKGGGVGQVGYVNVKVLVNQLTADNKVFQSNTLFNLPFTRIQGGTNAVIVDPVVGDIGLAVFCHRDISSVKNARAEAPPASSRILSASDGVYIGGILNGTPTRFAHLHDGGIDVTAPDKITLNAPEIVINATSSLKINTPSNTINAPMNQVNGQMSVTGGMTGGDGMHMTGDITTVGDVTADGISLKGHVHGGVQSGGSKTSTPE